MERRNYSKPFMALEAFTPQEYCAGCRLIIDVMPSDDFKKKLRIDWSGDGICDGDTEGGYQYIALSPTDYLSSSFVVYVDVWKYVGLAQSNAGLEAGNEFASATETLVDNATGTNYQSPIYKKIASKVVVNNYRIDPNDYTTWTNKVFLNGVSDTGAGSTHYLNRS